MELTQAHYQLIKPYLPVQRGNVTIPNIRVLNAILYVAEHGCKWRGLPSRFGNCFLLEISQRLFFQNASIDSASLVEGQVSPTMTLNFILGTFIPVWPSVSLSAR